MIYILFVGRIIRHIISLTKMTEKNGGQSFMMTSSIWSPPLLSVRYCNTVTDTIEARIPTRS